MLPTNNNFGTGGWQGIWDNLVMRQASVCPCLSLRSQNWPHHCLSETGAWLRTEWTASGFLSTSVNRGALSPLPALNADGTEQSTWLMGVYLWNRMHFPRYLTQFTYLGRSLLKLCKLRAIFQNPPDSSTAYAKKGSLGATLTRLILEWMLETEAPSDNKPAPFTPCFAVSVEPDNIGT